ncbi:MAG: hypothetical protein L6R48_01880 [Planctomycetes bacterium]|nr:hypothetical protein [Planctomycetota bacterium]
MTDPVPSSFKRRDHGLRWTIIHGGYRGLQRFALEEAQRLVQMQVPYVVELAEARADLVQGEEHWLVIGTLEGNPLLAALVRDGLLDLPEEPQGYAIACLEAPGGPGRRLVAIVGATEAGLIHGVCDFGARDLGVEISYDEAWDPAHRPGLDKLAPGRRRCAPGIADRGIWTWGYVLYDYRRFIDNMARLRFNLLTIWNDKPPINAAEVIDYAHSRGIRVVLGFHWGWGSEGLDLGDPAHVASIERWVMAEYEREYAHLPHDGIYFQTLTEHRDLDRGGVPLARVVCGLANRIGGALLVRHPGLAIQFGLHATSIGSHYRELEALDARISLVWEDAGVLPYSYPAADRRVSTFGAIQPMWETFDETLAYSLQLAALRQGREFALVPKGFQWLRWGSEFENHGRFLLGRRSAHFIRRRAEERQPMWDVQNGLWMANYPQAVRFFRALMAASGRMLVTPLVEDGLFEERIQPSIALFANLIWDPAGDPALLPRLAYSSYYRLA